MLWWFLFFEVEFVVCVVFWVSSAFRVVVFRGSSALVVVSSSSGFRVVRSFVALSLSCQTNGGPTGLGQPDTRGHWLRNPPPGARGEMSLLLGISARRFFKGSWGWAGGFVLFWGLEGRWAVLSLFVIRVICYL